MSLFKRTVEQGWWDGLQIDVSDEQIETLVEKGTVDVVDKKGNSYRISINNVENPTEDDVVIEEIHDEVPRAALT